MRRTTALLLALVSVAVAGGQTVTAPKEVTAPVGRLATIVVQSDGADTRYFADDGLDVFREYDPDAKTIRLRVVGYTAGKYYLRAITCRDNKLSDPVTVTVVIGGAAVDPVKPDPVKPEPANKAEKVAVVVVEESAQRTVKQAEQLASLRKWADGNGHTLFVVDKDDASVQRNGYASHVSKTGVPCVLVFDQKGSDKPLSVFKLDADPIAKVKEVVK